MKATEIRHLIVLFLYNSKKQTVISTTKLQDELYKLSLHGELDWEFKKNPLGDYRSELVREEISDLVGAGFININSNTSNKIQKYSLTKSGLELAKLLEVK